MSDKVMRLVNPDTGLMECKVCGARHQAQVKPDSGGKFYRGSWQCPNGCRIEPGKGEEKKAVRPFSRRQRRQGEDVCV